MRSAKYIAMFLLCTAAGADAATIQASSCGRDQVAAAVNSAKDGDTVLVPAGTCTWTSTLSITDKSITLQGAGIGQTVIIDGIPVVGYDPKPYLLSWKTKNSGGSPAGFTRLTGFTFDGGNAGNNAIDQGNAGHLSFWGNSHQLRVDHNRFIPTRSAAARFHGNLTGVVDHNQLDLGTNFRFGFYVHHESWNDVGDYGDNSFATDNRWGSPDFLFFEDNTFKQIWGGYIYAVDGWAGARVVHRKNTFIDAVWANHGLETGGRPRSMRAAEVYQNTFTMTENGVGFPSAIGFRGGTGMVWGNTTQHSSVGYFNNVVDLINLRSGDPRSFYIWEHCDGSNAWDQNTPGQNGWRCMDQVGVGKGALISGDVPSPARWLNSQSEPLYAFQNLRVGVLQGAAVNMGPILPNRDVYSETGGFDGSSGVGSGPLGSRPSSCTPGVAYWATDQGEWDATHAGPDGQLYKCVSTNSWSLFYTPYTYPHPLVTGTAVSTTTPAPQPPANVRLIK
jgi:hypothetical protein